jgi:hypothetical protein
LLRVETLEERSVPSVASSIPLSEALQPPSPASSTALDIKIQLSDSPTQVGPSSSGEHHQKSVPPGQLKHLQNTEDGDNTNGSKPSKEPDAALHLVSISIGPQGLTGKPSARGYPEEPQDSEGSPNQGAHAQENDSQDHTEKSTLAEEQPALSAGAQLALAGKPHDEIPRETEKPRAVEHASLREASLLLDRADPPAIPNLPSASPVEGKSVFDALSLIPLPPTSELFTGAGQMETGSETSEWRYPASGMARIGTVRVIEVIDPVVVQAQSSEAHLHDGLDASLVMTPELIDAAMTPDGNILEAFVQRLEQLGSSLGLSADTPLPTWILAAALTGLTCELARRQLTATRRRSPATADPITTLTWSLSLASGGR